MDDDTEIRDIHTVLKKGGVGWGWGRDPFDGEWATKNDQAWTPGEAGASTIKNIVQGWSRTGESHLSDEERIKGGAAGKFWENA